MSTQMVGKVKSCVWTSTCLTLSGHLFDYIVEERGIVKMAAMKTAGAEVVAINTAM